VTGSLLVRIARVALHEETFDLIVEPAVADLQFRPEPAAHVGAWLALLGALLTDFETDSRSLIEDAAMLATLVAIQACYYSGILLLLVAGMTGDNWSTVSRRVPLPPSSPCSCSSSASRPYQRCSASGRRDASAPERVAPRVSGKRVPTSHVREVPCWSSPTLRKAIVVFPPCAP
jgi:hypothetical protein